MKKFASLLLTAVLLAAMLSVFAVPAFAEEEPTKIEPQDNLTLFDSGNYIISSGNYTLSNFCIENADATLTIAEGVTVTVTNNFNNLGTINVCGKLTISDTVEGKENNGTIRIISCCNGGMQVSDMRGPGSVSTSKHWFIDGVCSVCGKACDNPFHNNDKCPDCGMSINGVVATGSTLSEGSLAIITAIAGLAVGAVGMYLFMKKKKPATAGGENTDEE